MNLRHQDFPRPKQKRRQAKTVARQWIRYSLSKYGVKRIKDIPCDFHYEYCCMSLMFLGFKYDYKTGIKTRI